VEAFKGDSELLAMIEGAKTPHDINKILTLLT
jgi:hypothetical protein